MKKELIEQLTKFINEEKTYEKGQSIFHNGSVIAKLGIVLKGSIQIEQNDFWGSRTIMDIISAGGFFGETYAITKDPMMVDVIAVENSKIGFINIEKIFSDGTPEEKMKLTSMLLKISATKNLNLSRKIMFTSPKTIRSRLTAFLTYQSKLNNSKEFRIPFDRQALADFLNIERTAMSKELGKMQSDGLLETKKNWFCLKKNIN